MPHKYTYPFFKPVYRSISQPYLSVRFVNPDTGKSFNWHCLIDTGADTSLFPAIISEMTGHNLKGKGVKKTYTLGVEGVNVPVYLHTFIMEVLSPDDPDKCVWKSKKLEIGCVENPQCPLLLGQQDFLKNFKITLDYPRERFTLQW